MGDVFDIPGIADLYGLDPSEFTAARNEVAKRLKKDGDSEAAAEVAKLRKPSRLTWAVNRVARDKPEHVEELLAASDAVRRAQTELIQGGNRDAFGEASRERRHVVARLADAVADLAGGNYRDEAVNLLDAASSDDAARPLLRAGRLIGEVAAPALFTFDALAEVDVREKGTDEPPRVDALEVKRRERDLARADEDLQRAQAHVESVQERLADAQRELKEARAAMRAATNARDEAANALDEAKNP